ncbi:HAMP domain-containing sensor histidine kinase [Compostibacter hankyongensis]|uniref:histidine kinase n=1 Tax=Compostibacter hankyongensis TaxID=1007089 RepID=A0ABP8G7V2_9BACT
MKKIFPWIVLLITLSLIGIITIQVSWIRNAVIMKREQFDNRMLQLLDNTQAELVQKRSMNGGEMQPGLGGKRSLWFNRNGTDLLSGQDISFWFTTTEVKNIIQRNMKAQGLDVPFEFAIARMRPMAPMVNEMYSSTDVFKQMPDTVHYQMFYTTLADNSVMNSLLPANNEMLFITVPANNRAFVLRSMSWIISGAVLFTLILIAAFSLTVYTMLRQKKLSEIKSDFINNMTHEFKTPLATISLAVDAIGNEKVLGTKEKVRYFTDIIKEENKRMNKQVETILQSAVLEKQEIRLNRQEVDVHEIIRKSVENLELQLQQKNGSISTDLHATHTRLLADEVHFSNAISNLLDNALKYSKEHPEIRISTHNTRKGIAITVTDNGIGMSKETVARIFEKFYRAHTGNLHNVKGFGLGLAYVKAIVEAHQGKIRVESALGKGSRFELEFPVPASRPGV